MVLNVTLSHRTTLGIVASLALLVLIAFCLTILQWQADWSLTHQPIARSKPQENQSTNMIASLPKSHLFGQSLGGDMPISSLQLQVTGIVKIDQDNGSTSKAYISMAGQPSKIYQVGDDLPNGVKVYAITADTVVLSRDGELEKLPLPREKLEFKAPNEISHDEYEGPN